MKRMTTDTHLSQYNKNTALGLCLFFGLFGAHRLYVERKSGMLQLGLGIVGMILVFSNDGAALVIGIIMLTGDISWVVLDAVRLITNSLQMVQEKL